MPGFITDVAGLICLLPWTRPLARRGIGLLIARQISRPAAGAASARSPFADETVIEGETVDPPKAQPEGPVIAGEIED